MEGIDNLLTLIKWQLIPQIVLPLFVQHLRIPNAVMPWTDYKNLLAMDLTHIF